MKIRTLTLTVGILCGLTILAANAPQSGTIISEKSVECGMKSKGKKSSTEVMRQQYVVYTATTEYDIRQPKPSDQDIIPANSPIEFTIDKDKMKFKLNGKGYEFLIVGTSALPAKGAAPQSR